jgi:uncharacterized protein
MNRLVVFLSLALCPAVVAAQAPAPAGAPVVFFSIFGGEGSTLQQFYAQIFGWSIIGAAGDLTTAVLSPLPASIGKGQSETIVYVGVEDITATLAKVVERGGTVRYPRFEVPGRVVLGVFKDPAGNSVGLVEMADGKVKVPK